MALEILTLGRKLLKLFYGKHMKKLSILIVLGSFLAGCSDYPSSGVVDTRDIREVANIEEISGAVFSVKSGAEDAARSYSADIQAIKDLDNKFRDFIISGAEGLAPQLALTYDGVSGTALESSVSGFQEAAQAWYDESTARHNAEIAGIQAEIDQRNATKAELANKGDAYNEKVSESKEAYEKLTKERDAKIVLYRAAMKKSKEDMAKFASSVGASANGSSPLEQYNFMDFSGYTSVPDACPEKAGRVTIDSRDTDKRCIYLTIPQKLVGTKVGFWGHSVLM
ncbi:hypothetical protein MELB17_08998 [Marinobacter sp. ELB17]|nr:hypothetical protein MELB17_08998 [Marinobacter sp. ELB17]